MSQLMSKFCREDYAMLFKTYSYDFNRYFVKVVILTSIKNKLVCLVNVYSRGYFIRNFLFKVFKQTAKKSFTLLSEFGFRFQSILHHW